MEIYEFDDYKKFIRHWIEGQPKNGRGMVKKIAECIGSQSVVVSQTLKGDRDFNLDQASALSDFFGFNRLQEEYFFTLVQLERCHTQALREKLNEKLNSIREEARKIENRIPQASQLSEAEMARFYSEWYYSAIRLLSALPEFNHAKDFSDYLGLPINKVFKAIEFLVSNGLCVSENGGLSMGIQSTHIGLQSPLLQRHLVNWRIRALKAIENPQTDDFSFVGPAVLSKNLAEKIRKNLVQFVEKTVREIGPSESEEVYCLNIDWFKI